MADTEGIQASNSQGDIQAGSDAGQGLDSGNATNLPGGENNLSDDANQGMPAGNEAGSETKSGVKIGEKEYTPEEYESIVNYNREQERLKQLQEAKPRDMQTLSVEIQRAETNLAADYNTFQNYFLSISQNPPTQTYDAQGNLTTVPCDGYKERAFQTGLETGDWSYFERTLPVDQVNAFRQQIGGLNNSARHLQALGYEIGKVNDLAQWNSYIETNLKDKPDEKYIFEQLSSKYDFDQVEAELFLNIYRGALQAREKYQGMTKSNDLAKQGLMNSTINGTPGGATSQKIFTRAEVARMSNAEFTKYEKTIMEQMSKGLLK